MIIGGILDLPKKSFKTRKASYKWSKIRYIGISTETFKKILWSNSSIQMWSISKDYKTGYVRETGPTKKFI